MESWHLWLVVDMIYAPLYASRGLCVTGYVYVIFLVMAINGLRNFNRIYRRQQCAVSEEVWKSP